MTKSDQAGELFAKGFSCSQVVFSTFAPELGLDFETAMKVSCGFGGGMAQTAATCGVVTGAIMVIGLKYGRVGKYDFSAKARTYQKVHEFMDKFTQRNQSLLCRDLLGDDMSTAEGKDRLHERGIIREVCPGFVRDGVEILEEILD
ncbi:hypothetical protein GF337_19975 [candidate division KSB1 bacterium]|nr:hypothetical protein [candidate division KSB1 bacterium]